MNASTKDEVVASRLRPFAWLPPASAAALLSVLMPTARKVVPRRDFAREGDRPRSLFVVVDGWACRYKTLPDGRRQILAFLVPGDFCDINVHLLGRRDHSLSATAGVEVGELHFEDLDDLLQTQPSMADALRKRELVFLATQREWTMNLGQRTAYERIAHLMCEMFLRMHAIGRTGEMSCDFPITQTDIADATGLTSVHVNRTVQALRSDGLLELKGRRLTVPDLPRLMDAALFDASYLHLDRENAESHG